MNFHQEIGVSALELGWVPSPTFIFRRSAILDTIRNWEPGSALEIGCGSGAIAYDVSRLGFQCTAVETSHEARDVANQVLRDNPKAQLSKEIPPNTQYDYILSFEVLEHIEDDHLALKNWLSHLRPGGHCLISVPAHRSKWNITDVAAGHYRRYDREDILNLALENGLADIEITTYGWPFSIFIEKLRAVAKNRQLRKKGIDPQEIALGSQQYTAKSGIERSIESKLFPIYGSWPGRKFFSLATAAQRLFFSTDKGISFMLKATKPND